MRRFYGCNLTDVLRGEVAPLREVADWVANLPPDCAVNRAMHPDGSWNHTHELELLRRILWASERAAFFASKSSRNKPEPFEFPWEDEDDDAIRGDPLTLEEADDFLGWDAEMKAHLGA